MFKFIMTCIILSYLRAVNMFPLNDLNKLSAVQVNSSSPRFGRSLLLGGSLGAVRIFDGLNRSLFSRITDPRRYRDRYGNECNRSCAGGNKGFNNNDKSGAGNKGFNNNDKWDANRLVGENREYDVKKGSVDKTVSEDNKGNRSTDEKRGNQDSKEESDKRESGDDTDSDYSMKFYYSREYDDSREGDDSGEGDHRSGTSDKGEPVARDDPMPTKHSEDLK